MTAPDGAIEELQRMRKKVAAQIAALDEEKSVEQPRLQPLRRPSEDLRAIEASNFKHSRRASYVAQVEDRRRRESLLPGTSPAASAANTGSRGRPVGRKKTSAESLKRVDLASVESSAHAWDQLLRICRGQKASGGWKAYLESVFASFDEDGSGEVDITEFRQAVEALGIKVTPKQLMLFRRDIDQDGDGHVSLKEFLLATRLRMKAQALEGHSDDPAVMALENAWSKLLCYTMENPAWKENVSQMFDTYDLDQSGDIDFDEFSTGIRVIGLDLDTEELEELLGDLDEDGGGSVSLDEFMCAVVQRLRMEQDLASAAGQDISTNSPGGHSGGRVSAHSPPVEEAKPRNIASTIHGIKLAEYRTASRVAWDKIISVTSGKKANVARVLKETFRKFDKDGSGQIDIDELAKGFELLGIEMTPEQTAAFRDDIDWDGDGLISEEEFQTGAKTMIQARESATSKDPSIRVAEEMWVKVLSELNRSPLGWSQAAQNMFANFDSDEDLSLTVDELSRGLKRLFGLQVSRGQAQLFSKSCDTDGDGEVSQSEFLSTVRIRQVFAGVTTGGVTAVESTTPEDLAKYALVTESAWAKVLEKARKSPESWKRNTEILFDFFDADQSGAIDVAELAKGLKFLGAKLTQTQAVAFRDDLDVDGDGEVSLEEFLVALRIRQTAEDAAIAIAAGSASKETTMLEHSWERILNSLPSDGWQAKVDAMFGSNERLGCDALAAALQNELEVRLSKQQLADFVFSTEGGVTNGTAALSQGVMKMATHQRLRYRYMMRGRKKISKMGEEARPAVGDEQKDESVLAAEVAWAKILDIAERDLSEWTRQMETLFANIDTDQSGEIDVDEFEQAMDSFGVKLTQVQLEAFRDEIDEDGSKTISLEEFLSAARLRYAVRRSNRGFTSTAPLPVPIFSPIVTRKPHLRRERSTTPPPPPPPSHRHSPYTTQLLKSSNGVFGEEARRRRSSVSLGR